jgi:clan AA aspartic protease (TIGR02281 family)
MPLNFALKHLRVLLAVAFTIFFVLGPGIFVSGLRAELYKWTDKSGGLHFTDAIGNIPPGAPYEVIENDQKLPPVKTIEGESGQSATGFSTLAPGSLGTAKEPETYVSILKKMGNSNLVKVIFNDSVSANMILDTGATHTMINTELARHLGYHSYRDYPLVFVRTVNAEIRNYMVLMPSVAIGRAAVENLEVIINPEFPMDYVGGLLGMNFFKDFDSSIDLEKGIITLTRFNTKYHGKLYEGFPLSWWRYKYEYYRENIRNNQNIQRLMKQAGEQDVAASVAKTSTFYQSLLEDLDNRAARAQVPWAIRLAGEK